MQPSRKDRIVRANWLGRYLSVEQIATNQIQRVLKDAATSIFEKLVSTGDSTESGKIRRGQLAIAKREIGKVINETFSETSDLIRDGQQNAAVAAIEARLFHEKGLIASFLRNPRDRERYKKSLEQTAKRNIQSTITRVNETAMPLSERVWKTRALARGTIDREINRALARGDSAEDLARRVASMVRPDAPGGISYAAMRLARTEINNAFHAQSINDAREIPWVSEMRWHLSKVHVEDPGDECEDYEEIGLFPIDKVPSKPHPQCRCYVTPEVLEYEKFKKNLLAGQYDSYIDEQMPISSDEAKAEVGRDKIKAPAAQRIPKDNGTWQTAQTPEIMGRRFVAAHPGMSINLSNNKIHRDDAAQILSAVDDMMTKYPVLQGNLTGIDIYRSVGQGNGAFAVTDSRPGGKSTIRFNANWLSAQADSPDRNQFYDSMAYVGETGHFPKGVGTQQPWYDITVHETGHALDNLGDHRAREKAIETELDVFHSLPDFAKGSESEWLSDGGATSLYSIHNGSLDPGEATAEAFADVVKNGDKAKPLSKALCDNLIREAEKGYNPKPLVTELSAAAEVKTLGGDYKLNGVAVQDFLDIPNDHGRYTYREIIPFYGKDDLDKRHDWEIGVADAPKVAEKKIPDGRTVRIFYDPQETDVVWNETRWETTNKGNQLVNVSQVKKDNGYIYRGMSAEEFESARRRGYFESTGKGNFESQQGMTLFSTEIDQAGTYATEFSYQENAPTFTKPGYVIKIPDRPSIKRTNGTEVEIPGRIPFSEVESAWAAKPLAIRPGTIGVQEGWNGWEQGGSALLQRGAEYRWAPVDLTEPTMHIDSVYHKVRENGGITIDLGGTEPHVGFAYSPSKTTERAIPLSEFTENHIEEFVDEWADELKKPGNHLGMWVENDHVYLDVSQVGTPTVETLKLAQDNDQLAVFDLSNLDSGQIDLGKIDKDGKYKPIDDPSSIFIDYQRKIHGADQSRSYQRVSTIQAGSDTGERGDVKIPEGWERYVKALAGQEDRTNEATVWVPVSELKKYQEYDRANDPASAGNMDALEAVIRLDGGIRQPIMLSTDGTKALVHEGNHRIAVAERLGIKELPVKISEDAIIKRNEGSAPIELTGDLKAFVRERLPLHDAKSGPEVYWTGPKVVEPVSNTMGSYTIDSIWGARSFDENKNYFREGARQVQEKGYWKNAKAIVDNNIYTPDSLRAAGKELVARAVHSEPSALNLYRGIKVAPETLRDLLEAQEISMPLSSFTTDTAWANAFAGTGDGVSWKSKDFVADGNGIIFKLMPGAKTAETNTGEQIAFGRFRIVKVIPGEIDKKVGNLTQYRYINGVKELVAVRKPDTIVLQQISMIEEGIGAQAVKAAAKDVAIPDISIVKRHNVVKTPKRTGDPLLDLANLEVSELGINPFGFTEKNDLDYRSVQEATKALQKITKKYPAVDISEFGFGDTDTGTVAITGVGKELVTKDKLNIYSGTAPEWLGDSSVITLNSKMGHDHDRQLKLAEDSVKKGFWPDGVAEKPWQGTVFHEYGHAMQNFLGPDRVSAQDIQELMTAEFKKTDWESSDFYKQRVESYRKLGDKIAPVPEAAARNDTFYKWLKDNMSGYSFVRDTININYEEALAEAFTDYEINGSKATVTSKALHRLMIRRYKDHVKYIAKVGVK